MCCVHKLLLAFDGELRERGPHVAPRATLGRLGIAAQPPLLLEICPRGNNKKIIIIFPCS